MVKYDIAAFAAHPDDLELAVGGTIIAHTRAGYRVAGVEMSRGEKSSNGTPEIRAEEAAAAAEVLGLEKRINLNLPDLGIEFSPEHLQVVVEAVRSLKPRVLLAPYWSSHHPDHENTGQLLRKAIFVASVHGYETESPPHRVEKIFYYSFPRHLSPSVIVDVSQYHPLKIEAIKKHESQFLRKEDSAPTTLNAPDFLERLQARDGYWGLMGSKKYGEPLYSERPLAVKHILVKGGDQDS